MVWDKSILQIQQAKGYKTEVVERVLDCGSSNTNVENMVISYSGLP